MSEFKIDLGVVSYPVLLGQNLLHQRKKLLAEIETEGSVYVIADIIITEKYDLSGLENQEHVKLFIVSGGKNNKSLFTAMKIFQDLEESNLPRDVTIVAVGGGVVGDLAGFVASCWYRGVNLIHVPTTLLSAVDSCVGGKTAINFRSTVNAVGSYFHPKKIIIDTSVLEELPEREISSGFGEIIKYAMIGGEEILTYLESSQATEKQELSKLIYLCLKQKEQFVKGDITEASKRLYLNFGHTIGHAIEFSTIYEGRETLRHGEGVALGMLAIFRICIMLGFLKESDIARLRKLLEKFNLPVSFDPRKLKMDREALIENITLLTFKDKKRVKKELRLIVLEKIGSPAIYKTSDVDLIRHGVSEVICQ